MYAPSLVPSREARLASKSVRQMIPTSTWWSGFPGSLCIHLRV